MTPAEGKKRLKKLYGDKAGWRVAESALRQEERASVLAALPAKREEKRRISEAMEARRKALLNADAEYAALRAQYEAVRAECDYDSGIVLSHRITVGKNLGWAFEVTGHGDNWAEAIRNAEAKAEGRVA
jgi:hypothetical protein